MAENGVSSLRRYGTDAASGLWPTFACTKSNLQRDDSNRDETQRKNSLIGPE